MTLMFARCGAHHLRGSHHHQNQFKLLEKLEQNPPKCKNNEFICEDPENEYPEELIEIRMNDYAKKQKDNIEFYSKFYDYNESYMKWMHETGLPPFIDQHCNTDLEEVSFPKVGMALNGSDTGTSHTYIVQREPYIVRRIAFIKCLGKKDTHTEGTVECKQNFSGVKVLTLDKSGIIKPKFIIFPFGCIATVKYKNNKSTETLTSYFNG